jgi:F420-0:gamma-glutamyl ligase
LPACLADGVASAGVLVVGGDVADAGVPVVVVVVMRVILSRGSSRSVVLETVEQPVEDLVSTDLALGDGVFALLAERRAELDGGDEEGAGVITRCCGARSAEGRGVPSKLTN